jgi:hypothetical protein
LQKDLIQEFVRAVRDALDALTVDPADRHAALVATMIEVINDQRFRNAWVDPEFQSACLTALEMTAGQWALELKRN